MHQRIVFTFIFSLILTFGWAGVPPSIVIVDDANPEAGQTVTFTLTKNLSICMSGGVCVKPANGTPCMPIAINGTATHVYSAPGNYTVELQCNTPVGVDLQKMLPIKCHLLYHLTCKILLECQYRAM